VEAVCELPDKNRAQLESETAYVKEIYASGNGNCNGGRFGGSGAGPFATLRIEEFSTVLT
jgi:hypothetical protein